MSGPDEAFSPRAGITWATDTNRVIVASADGRRAHVLEGTEAAVWSWLSLSPPEGRLVDLAAGLFGVEPQVATERVRALLLAWCDAGLLEPTRAGGAIARG